MRASMELDIEGENWSGATVSANNLSELELARGEVLMAVTTGEQSVTYADLSGHAFLQISSRTTLADALHQASLREESQRLFNDAESRQTIRQPKCPRLYSSQGFRYCDLLLSDAERSMWKNYVLVPLMASAATCDAANERAAYALNIAEAGYAPLLTIALDHLTLARATLYKSPPDSPIPQVVHDHITAAVDGFREANAMHQLPRGLLKRAWLRFLSGDEPGCRENLDEAWEITERGPMPLFQADIQLYRARLFRDRTALAEARRLIEKHGYHRRDEELADAEAAAEHWNDKEPSVPTKVFISYSHDSERHLAARIGARHHCASMASMLSSISMKPVPLRAGRDGVRSSFGRKTPSTFSSSARRRTSTASRGRFRPTKA